MLNTDHLPQLVSDAAFQIQQELIRRTGTNYMEASQSERVKFEPPPVGTPTSLGLSNAPALLYGSDATADDIVRAWDIIAKAVAYRGDASIAEMEANHVFPRLPPSRSTTDIAVRFLQAASWLGFERIVGPDKLTVRIGNTLCGFVDFHVVGSTLRLVPRMKIPDIAEILNRSVGRKYMAMAKTTAIYRSLIRLLPDQKDAIHALTQIAVHGGTGCELRFIEPFDVVVIRASTGSKDLWGQARRIVNESTTNPAPALFKILSRAVDYSDFVKHIGNPYRHGVGITLRSRAKALDAISYFELGGSDTQATGGLEMLAYQKIIGSVNV